MTFDLRNADSAAVRITSVIGPTSPAAVETPRTRLHSLDGVQSCQRGTCFYLSKPRFLGLSPVSLQSDDDTIINNLYAVVMLLGL